MNFITEHLLSLILFVPALAAVIMLFLPNGENKLFRWFAFGASLIPLVLSLVVWFNFNAPQPGFQFQETITWYRSDRFLPPPWRGWSLADDGPADHVAHAACHPGFVQHQLIGSKPT